MPDEQTKIPEPMIGVEEIRFTWIATMLIVVTIQLLDLDW